MDTRYTPPAGSAACPRCDAVIDGAPALSAAIELAMIHCRCPRCAGVWEELRTPQGVTRYWDRAVVAGQYIE